MIRIQTTERTMPIDTAELRKQSHLAALLTAVASLIVLSSLAISSWLTFRATQNLKAIQTQTRIAKQNLVDLRQDVAALRSQRNELTSALSQVVTGNAQAARQLDIVAARNDALARAVPRIFIHESNNAQLANEIAQSLRAKGYVVLAPDTVSYNSLKDEILHPIEIFYFGQSDDSQTVADVEAIREAMHAASPDLGWAWAQQDVDHYHPLRTYVIFLRKQR